MNWDWEKLQKQNKQHGGGQGAGPPPQFDEMLEKLKNLKFSGGPIIVVVVMDFMAQVQAHLMSHQYEGLMKKANLKSYGKGGVIR